MFPLKDDSPRKTFPIINLLLIIINITVFIIQLGVSNYEGFISQYGFIPSQFNLTHQQAYIPLLSSLFLHGGILHLLANMWFLHIFGDNIEDRLGHLRYLIFYVLAGIAAAFSQYMLDPSSSIPMIGASGAISGVSGAYFVLFRNSRILSLVVLGFLITTTKVPAWIFLGIWFVIQLFSGFGSLAQVQSGGGIAFFAHIGGFVFGYLFIKLFYREKEISTELA
ncbi:MAG TPA: rhomboid family intramembrane serine protease [Candidatus Nitrosocosmicus sp.]|nr:rhomboid family intramembrane serine protease [Candidatus Nitrosocosmicus sp.]